MVFCPYIICATAQNRIMHLLSKILSHIVLHFKICIDSHGILFNHLKTLPFTGWSALRLVVSGTSFTLCFLSLWFGCLESEFGSVISFGDVLTREIIPRQIPSFPFQMDKHWDDKVGRSSLEWWACCGRYTYVVEWHLKMSMILETVLWIFCLSSLGLGPLSFECLAINTDGDRGVFGYNLFCDADW